MGKLFTETWGNAEASMQEISKSLQTQRDTQDSAQKQDCAQKQMPASDRAHPHHTRKLGETLKDAMCRVRNQGWPDRIR